LPCARDRPGAVSSGCKKFIHGGRALRSETPPSAQKAAVLINNRKKKDHQPEKKSRRLLRKDQCIFDNGVWTGKKPRRFTWGKKKEELTKKRRVTAGFVLGVSRSAEGVKGFIKFEGPPSKRRKELLPSRDER